MKSLEGKNEDFEFELHIKGKVHIPHYTEEDLEEKLKCAREILEGMRDVLKEKGYDSDLDFDVKENFSEVW